MKSVAQGNTLSHAETEAIFNDAKKGGSLRESVLAHTAEYGIDQIDWLFPDYKNLNNPPEFIKRDTGWVAGVWLLCIILLSAGLRACSRISPRTKLVPWVTSREIGRAHV